jgi:hypothetical protein
LFQFLFQALAQFLRAAEHAFTAARFKEQPVPVTGSANLAAVLVAPRCQTLQGLPLRRNAYAMPWRVTGALSAGLEIRNQLWKANGQPACR